MARKEIGIPLNRENRNNHNDNFKELYDDFKNVVDKVSDEAFNKVIDGSKIDWSKMVDTVNDLPSNAEVGETRGVKSDNKIYRYNGSSWIDIAEINLNPIAEVDDRLSSQLADTVQELQNTKNNFEQTISEKPNKTEVRYRNEPISEDDLTSGLKEAIAGTAD